MSRESGREIIRDLFTEGGKSGNSNSQWGSTSSSPSFLREEDWRMANLHLETLKKKSKEQDAKIETLATKMNDLVSASKVRFERVAGQIQRQDESVHTNMVEMNAKIAQLSSRLNERRLADNKIQELVDRHNQIVQNFELRMGQLQKIISEQELLLANARSELKDALREISRLKRL